MRACAQAAGRQLAAKAAAASSRAAASSEASTAAAAAAGRHLHTLAQLSAGARGLQRLSAVGDSLKAELAELERSIPLLVRSIWGTNSAAVVAALRQRQATTAARLIRRWEEAEHQLVAVANSLTTLHNGQKLVAVGVPLAAAQLWPRPAHAYYAPALQRAQRTAGAELSLTLGQLQAAVARAANALREEAAIAARGAFLLLLFVPALLTAVPALLLGGDFRARWLDLIRWTLENAGAAFIKWGQWAATRPDLFPSDACAALAALQTKAPTHAWRHTAAAVESSFGAGVDELFSEFAAEPVASGSIAQVYRAVLSERGAELAGRRTRGGLLPLVRRERLFKPGSAVAVKVRHPGVNELMEKDVVLMRRAATLLGALFPGAALKESVMQFGAPLREQLDLQTEAAHLDAFGRNFKHWSGVSFPQPADAPLVSPSVLVETFEQGELISTYVGTSLLPPAFNRRLADLGLHCFLKMLLKDNFIHADLHPGNILVRLDAPAPGGLLDRLGRWSGLELRLPRLVLLDVGMIARLSGEDQSNLVGFFKGLTSMNGGELADSIMTFTEEAPPNPAAFREDMDRIFAGLDPELLRTNTPDVINTMMDTIRRHGVHLKGVVSTVVITTMVLEGWSTKLNPDIRILDTLRDILPQAWGVRFGKALDRTFSAEALTLAWH